MTIAANGNSSPKDGPIAPFKNHGVKGYHTFIPQQPHQIGSLLPAEQFPQNASPPGLFKPLDIRGVRFGHRAWVAPMCQYSSDDGKATDHHFVHLGSMALRGWSTIIIEATAVVPEGRISPEDSGIWSDDHIPGFKRAVDYVHAHKGLIGIQLAHAGRKGSTLAPWVERIARDEHGWTGGSVAAEENNGWPNTTIGPSEISFHDGHYPEPVAASLEYIENLKQAYLDAVERCKVIGFDFIEIHGAHGYLFHEFTSPVSNTRTDKYGGNLENRLRLPLEVSQSIRKAWDGPLFYRVSASDWLEEVEGPEKGHPNEEDEYAWWGIEQTTILTQKLADIGIDLIDVSSGGNDLRGKIKVGPSYQVPFAKHIKENVKNILVGTVGIITDPIQANDIIENGEADVVLQARQVLRDIDFHLEAAEQLGVAVAPAVQYERAWSRMVVKRETTKHDSKHTGQSEVEGEEKHGVKSKV